MKTQDKENEGESQTYSGTVIAEDEGFRKMWVWVRSKHECQGFRGYCLLGDLNANIGQGPNYLTWSRLSEEFGLFPNPKSAVNIIQKAMNYSRTMWQENERKLDLLEALVNRI